MSRLPREFVFKPQDVGVYHSINRCVRWSMRCGWDPFTQRSSEHRKRWLRQRLMFGASVMAIDIEGFCTMANHRHRIVRNRPDVAGKWSAEEIESGRRFAVEWILIHAQATQASSPATEQREC